MTVAPLCTAPRLLHWPGGGSGREGRPGASERCTDGLRGWVDGLAGALVFGGVFPLSFPCCHSFNKTLYHSWIP